MKNIAKKAYASSKRFVARHKVGFAFATGATLGIVANKYALRDHDNFLREHGLYDAFYTPSDEEMGS